jgi:hypothetical protein
MASTDWKQELRKTLNLIPYISNPNIGEDYFEFIFLPNGKTGKQAELRKDKLEKLIDTIKEKVSLNAPVDIQVENQEIAGKTKYTIRAIPYSCYAGDKSDLFDGSAKLLCGIIKDYLYCVERIKKS